jgi:hypothetical protein
MPATQKKSSVRTARKSTKPSRRTRPKRLKPAPAASITPVLPADAPPHISLRDKLFIERFVSFRDVARCAEYVCDRHKDSPPMFALEECEAIYARPEIKAAINERIEMAELEHARLSLTSGKLRDPAFLDSHTAANVEECPPGAAKTGALKLGYIVAGVIAKNELALRPQDPNAKPNIYRALQTTTVQRVTETITETKEIEVPAPEKPALPAAEEDEVLDY